MPKAITITSQDFFEQFRLSLLLQIRLLQHRQWGSYKGYFLHSPDQTLLFPILTFPLHHALL